MEAIALLHLLQLASPALPIGGYSYSQGLESAMAAGLVSDATSARSWIVGHLRDVMAQFEAPVLWYLIKAFADRDGSAVIDWSACFVAARDTAEFRAETIQMGYSLGKLLAELVPDATDLLALLQRVAALPFPTAYACAAVALGIDPAAALLGMLFVWTENQVLVCVKSVPLGQVAGQRMLLSLQADIAAAAQHAQHLDQRDLSCWTPGLSYLSMRHEDQYSRLYRS